MSRYSGWGLLEPCRRLLGHSLGSSWEAVGFESRYIFGHLRVLFTCVFALRPPCVKPLPNGDSYEMCYMCCGSVWKVTLQSPRAAPHLRKDLHPNCYLKGLFLVSVHELSTRAPCYDETVMNNLGLIMILARSRHIVGK